MTIHQSKGLEFPVVFLADLSRQFNRSDASMSVLLDSSLYIGANVVDMEKRAYFPSLARMAIAEKKTRQTIAEELRVLYVAMTRAKEMLVMSYCSGKLSSTLKKWNEALTLPLPPPDGRQRALPGRLGADGSALPDGSRRVVCRDRSQ